MFKRLFTFILLSAVFLGGYYLGHLPGSPDIFARAQEAYQRVTVAADNLPTAGADRSQTARVSTAVVDTGFGITIAGKTFSIGGDEKTDRQQ